MSQNLSQDLETGCPKLAIVKFWGILFQGRPQSTQITIINMHLLIEIGHNSVIQRHGYYIKLENFQLYA